MAAQLQQQQHIKEGFMRRLILFLLIFVSFSPAQNQWDGFPGWPNNERPLKYAYESTVLFNRMVPQPETPRKGRINTLIVNLKNGGVWDKLEELWLLSSKSQTNSNLNWIDTTNTIIPIGSPLFTIDRGYKGDGVGAYLDLNYIPSSDAVKYGINSGTVGVYTRQTAEENLTDVYSSDGTSRIQIKINYSGGYFYGSINTGIGANYLPLSNNGLGSMEVKRIDASNMSITHNGVKVNDLATPSVGLPTVALTIMKYGGSYTTKEHCAVWIGSYLTDAESLTMHTEIERYLDSIGAGVIP
jgi:hypothetical protein